MTAPKKDNTPSKADSVNADDLGGVFLAGQQGEVVEVSGDGRFYEQHLAGDRTRQDENAS